MGQSIRARAGQLGNRVAAVAMAAVLVAGMSPGLALASSGSSLEVAGFGDAGRPALAGQASKQTVYVLKSAKMSGAKWTYSYDGKTGLLKKETSKERSGGSGKKKYSYNGKHVLSTITQNDKYGRYAKGLTFKSKVSLTSTSGGRFKKSTEKGKYSNGVIWKKTVKCKYKSGRVVKAKISTTRGDAGGTYPWAGKATYTYKGGRMVLQHVTKSALAGYRYSYDAHGNIDKKRSIYLNGSTSEWENLGNVYNAKGLLAKRNSTTYSWKRLRVSKATAAKVKAQQWALLNDNLNFALGTYV